MEGHPCYATGMNISHLQKPSRYINSEINAVHADKFIKVALAFPDIYEIGMSHLGIRILYKIINDMSYASAERVFSPWTDLEAALKAKGVLLSSLETGRPLRDFDIVGFSLQYELSYTTVLNMLSLGGIPVKSEDRLSSSSVRHPLVIAGGPCTVNPLPMSPFIDAFLIGDGEEAITEILETFYQWKKNGDWDKESLLDALSHIEGMFVPSVHGIISGGQPTGPFSSPPFPHPPFSVRRRILSCLDDAPFPDKPIIPYTSIVHDRINIEVSRGCPMGCRFCQAGMIYRPIRERSPRKVLNLAEAAIRNTGYEEVAFTSLSAGDYSCLLDVVREFRRRFGKDNIAVSLPSLRISSIQSVLLKEISAVRKTGFTIAPEAGTERLRNVINKDFSDAEYERALHILFKEGWLNLKLYFMIGLPTETEEDIDGILAMAFTALSTAKRHTKRFININIGITPYIPKAHTPFQWHGQRRLEELQEKKNYIRKRLSKKGFHIKGHDTRMSLLEAAFTRGDTRISPLLEKAWSLGCRLDGWTEVFQYEKWEEAMLLTGIDAPAFAEKSFALSDTLPWDFVDARVTKEFLRKEYQKALTGTITPDCRKICHRCGLDCEKSDKSDQSAPATRPFPAEKVTTGASCVKRFNPVRIRAEFSKTGRLRYLSHLELVTMFHRAMRRAGLRLEYSKGFHPTPQVSFGPPLGVAIEGLREYFDMVIVPPFDLVTNRKRLNETLPNGICVHDMIVIPPGDPSLNAFICRYEYEIRGVDMRAIERFLSKKEVLVEREKGTINIRDMVHEISERDENSIVLTVADLKDFKVRLGELTPYLCDKSLNELDVTRIALYGWRGDWMKPIERSMQWTAKY